MNELIEQLSAIVDGGIPASASDKKFADSLLNGKYGFRKRGYLTVNQQRAAENMVERMKQPQPPEAKTSDLGKVYAFIEKAKQHLKFPKIVLMLSDGTGIKVYMSGPRSKYPDTVNIQTMDRGWFGRIFRNGEWHKPRSMTFQQVDETTKLMNRLAADPAAVASEYGHLTGHCCFCNRKLDDERSTKVGYGPVCADHYGLPWGSK